MQKEDELLSWCRYKDNQCYIYPNYVDIGFLIYRKDLLEEINKEPPATWEELKVKAKQAADKLNSLPNVGNRERLWGFALPSIHDRITFMSCLWELVWSYGGEIFQDEKAKPGKSELVDKETGALKEPLRSQLTFTKVVDVLAFIQELIFEKIAPLPYWGDMRLRAVFSRQWSSAYQAMIEEIGIKDKEGKIKEEYKLLRNRLNIDPEEAAKNILGVGLIPIADKLSEAVRNKKHGHYTIWGAWCLGTMSKALSPEIGWSLIEAMTSTEKMRNRAIKGAGLPVNKQLYNDPLVRASNPSMYKHALEIFNNEWAIPRSKIPHYNKIASTLYRELTKKEGILGYDYLKRGTKENAKPSKDLIKKSLEAAEEIIIKKLREEEDISIEALREGK